ncbi:MAG: glycosyltransferase family 1 protein [Candidatus Portnoybacteria bacterium]|nr:glycosyltransferase family 1 protein [Candidatus Portnoybacteria bacterium]MDD4982417.1 glycosyltransferase family 1 protein [Candidatus Portnoybacteria bacterium]
MIIGINAAAAIKQPRTGVEEYAYQLIKHLTMLPEAREHRFLLYLPDTDTRISANDTNKKYFDFLLPPNFEIKILRWPLPFLWTQIRLAWEVWRHKPDTLFIPVHILPFGAPPNSVVALHGLEYEHFPQYYSFWRRMYLRWSTKHAFKRAKKIIAISENTKRDLVKLYGGEAEKISVVHHGVTFSNPSQPPLNLSGGENHPSPSLQKEGEPPPLKLRGGKGELFEPYLLYIGRIETKKNIQGILEAYKILKEEYGAPHRLVLAGAPGYGYKNLKKEIEKFNNCHAEFISASRGIPKQVRDDKIVELGYISEDAKWQLLSNAAVFLFPSFYEGFGLPVLEAQAASVSVITSYGSCLPEIAGSGALFVNPQNPAQIAEAAKQIIDDKALRDKLIQLGYENVKRFSWDKCARETLKILIS